MKVVFVFWVDKRWPPLINGPSVSSGAAQRSMRWRPWSRSQNPSLWRRATDLPLAQRGDGTAHPFLQGSTVPPTRSAGPPWVLHLLHCPVHTRPWCLFPTGSPSTSTQRGETLSWINSITSDYRRNRFGFLMASILAMIQFLCIYSTNSKFRFRGAIIQLIT